jgi:hypothetical protein
VRIDDVNFVTLLDDFKEFVAALAKKRNVPIGNTFICDTWHQFCQEKGISTEWDTWIMELYLEEGITKVIGHCGPVDCPDMFTQFEFCQ